MLKKMIKILAILIALFFITTTFTRHIPMSNTDKEKITSVEEIFDENGILLTDIEIGPIFGDNGEVWVNGFKAEKGDSWSELLNENKADDSVVIEE
jgi:uncharacterized membrane protein (Fun14 family)